jgi:hypothetical protein
MKIRLIFLLSITFLIVVLTTSFFLGKINTEILPVDQEVETNPDQTVGGDRDEHGCIGSAEYSWCEDKKKCLRPWEEPCTQKEGADKKSITESLLQKHNWGEGEIEVFVQRNIGDYASGLVKEVAEPSGAMFFAAKVNES